MKPMRDRNGLPCLARLRFYDRAALVGEDGKPDYSKVAGLEPRATVDVFPEVLFASHVEDLEFELGRDRPDLEGRDLPLTLGLEPDREPALPLVEAVDEDGKVVACRPVSLSTLGTEYLVGPLQRRGLDPKGLVYAVSIVPRETGTRSGGAFAPVSREEPGPATIRVPGFPQGRHPGPGTELSPDHAWGTMLPVYLPRAVLDGMAEDEARFATRAGPGNWHERCWFLTGHLTRDGATLAATVVDAVPAQRYASCATALELTADSWSALHEHLERTGQRLIAWVHTHSIRQLALQAERDRKVETPAPAEEPAKTEAAPALPDSGLFLSAADVSAARDRGFRSPWILTGVLDSDAAADGVTEAGRLLAFWGWTLGFLVRRSAILVD